MELFSESIFEIKPSTTGKNFILKVPYYHRAAAGLLTGTTVFVLPLVHSKEMIITPLKPDNWGDIWRIEMFLLDKPGAVRSVLETMKRNNINILLEESNTDCSYIKNISNSKAHKLTLIIDLEKYNEVVDGHSEHRNTIHRPNIKPNRLINEIIYSSREYVLTSNNEDQWAFKFERVEFFFRNKENRLNYDLIKVHRGHLRIPVNLFRSFYSTLPSELWASVTSDHDDKWIKISFLEREKRYLNLKVKHRDAVGILYKMSKELARLGINIRSSFSRMVFAESTAEWFALLEASKDISSRSFLDFFAYLNDPSKDLYQSVDSFSVIEAIGFEFDINKEIQSRASSVDSKYQMHKSKHSNEKDYEQLYYNLKEAVEGYENEVLPANARVDFPSPLGKSVTHVLIIASPEDPTGSTVIKNLVEKSLPEKSTIKVIGQDDFAPITPHEMLDNKIQTLINSSMIVLADVTYVNHFQLYCIGYARGQRIQTHVLCRDINRNSRSMIFSLAKIDHFYSNSKGEDLSKKINNWLSSLSGHIKRNKNTITDTPIVSENVVSDYDDFTVLHLSDLHVTENFDCLSEVNFLLDDLQDKKEGPGVGLIDCIVISGDITDKATPLEFEKAAEFVSELKKRLHWKRKNEDYPKMVVTPGNHDTDWAAKVYDFISERKVDESSLRDGRYIQVALPAKRNNQEQLKGYLIRDEKAYKSRFKNFSEHFYRHIMDEPYPLEFRDQSISHFFKSKGIQFLTLNSAWEIDEHFQERSGIFENSIARGIEQANSKAKIERDHFFPLLRFAVFHHPVSGFGNENMQNSDFMEHLQKNDFQFVLHGHIHEPRLNSLYNFMERKIHSIGCGTFGAVSYHRPPSTPRLYNILRVHDNLKKVTIHTRQRPKEGGAWSSFPIYHLADSPHDKSSKMTLELDSIQESRRKKRIELLCAQLKEGAPVPYRDELASLLRPLIKAEEVTPSKLQRIWNDHPEKFKRFDNIGILQLNWATDHQSDSASTS